MWQGDANPSLMTWNWRKQPEAVSDPSSNRMNHRQLSKKARNLCKDRGNLLEIQAESITVHVFMCWSLFSEHWARHKAGVTKNSSSHLKPRVDRGKERVSNLKNTYKLYMTSTPARADMETNAFTIGRFKKLKLIKNFSKKLTQL